MSVTAKLELLAPAGDRQKAEVAIAYGADAIYVGGKTYSLRAGAGNFDLTEMQDLVGYAHGAGVKVYVAVNSLLHNPDLEGLADYLRALAELGVDGLIFADPAVYAVAREVAPALPLHVSTQASITNLRSVQFWASLGVRRVILARELSLSEIREIRDHTAVELEAFVHGAMCMAYSGRCLLSHYLTGRDANRGQCAQACRWRYALVEEKRPGEYYPVQEDAGGTYILNSRDLNMLAHIPALAAAGITSLKIEGRMKSVYYVGVVVKAYREALDGYQADPDNYRPHGQLLHEVEKVSHRPYTTGFYFGPPGAQGQYYTSSGYVREYEFVGIVPAPAGGRARVAVRNRICCGDQLELVTPSGPGREFVVAKMWDDNGALVTTAHPNQEVFMDLGVEAPARSMLRRLKPPAANRR